MRKPSPNLIRARERARQRILAGRADLEARDRYLGLAHRAASEGESAAAADYRERAAASQAAAILKLRSTQ